MPSSELSEPARSDAQLRELHRAVLEIVSAIHQPQRDLVLLREAGVSLDRALLPLLVGIQRFGPIGVGSLADRVGRDYSTVSRQVAKLESLGLVGRTDRVTDRRVSEATLTAQGRRVAARIDLARDRLLEALFQGWSGGEVEQLVRLLRRFADAFGGESAPHSHAGPIAPELRRRG
jgi:DNA-binding MarR family transcriptional regulator